MESQKKILLIRHGTTAFNQADRLQGRIDNPLNETGEAEVARLAELIRDEPLDVIYCSPLVRARQTAEAIRRVRGGHCGPGGPSAPLRIVADFHEIDLGDWEGLDYTTVKERDPEFFNCWLEKADQAIPNGESFTQVCERVKPALAEILRGPEQAVAIVGHATVNRAILAILLAMEPAVARRFRVSNAAVARLTVFENSRGRRTVVDAWNQTAPLPTPE